MGSTAVVVGAGVFGLSTARALARRGWRVDIVDRHPLASIGPSAAEARILRFSHGSRVWYTDSAIRAARLWRQLELETRRDLFCPSGVLLLVSEGHAGSWELRSELELRSRGVPVEHLTPDQVRRRFPGIASPGLEFALFEPTAGVVRAREALLALAYSATTAGARLIRGAAAPLGDGAVLVDGRTLRADLVVWAVGPAIPAAFTGITRVTMVRQDSYFLDVPRQAREARLPPWIDVAAGYYGVPALSDLGPKVVPDLALPADAGGTGAVLPPDLAQYLGRRIPGLACAPVKRCEPCWYAATSDDEFLLTKVPKHPRTWLVGGDSGHGFKHGPAWGEYVSDVVEGRAALDPRFSSRSGAGGTECNAT
jgi:sarcosine oxidase